MKKMKTLFTLLLVAVMTITTSVSVFAEENTSKDAKSEVGQLKADIAKIESVDYDDLKEFYNKNNEWIEDVNTNLEEYMTDIPQAERDNELKKLRGDNLYTLASVSDYFNSHTFHLRNGYWTYSMEPKMSTRLLRPYANAGWDELVDYYYSINTDSLQDQYMCHFDAFIESDWDIEQGRPNVSYAATLLALCNPD